jgi:hypothetical protein
MFDMSRLFEEYKARALSSTNSNVVGQGGLLYFLGNKKGSGYF